MIKIGITGSLASGKTTVAKLFTGKNYPYFSADSAVKKFYKNKNFIKNIKKILKLQNSGNINKEVKHLLLNKNSILKKLEKFIHPLVRKKMKRFMVLNKNKKIMILEIPLLIESKIMKLFDVIIFVSSRKNIRIKRYLKNGGDLRIFNILDKRQMNQSKKTKFCNHIVLNNNSLFFLKRQIRNIIKIYE